MNKLNLIYTEVDLLHLSSSVILVNLICALVKLSILGRKHVMFILLINHTGTLIFFRFSAEKIIT